jgi:transposase-like protein
MENKIRKDSQVQEFLQQTNKDLKKTYDLISNKYPVKCKICKSGDLVEKIYISGFKLFLCNKCEFLGLYEGLESELNTYFS